MAWLIVFTLIQCIFGQRAFSAVCRHYKRTAGILGTKIDETISKLKTDGITDKELLNSKAQLKGNMMLRLESTSSRMTRNGKMSYCLASIRH